MIEIKTAIMKYASARLVAQAEIQDKLRGSMLDPRIPDGLKDLLLIISAGISLDIKDLDTLLEDLERPSISIPSSMAKKADRFAK